MKPFAARSALTSVLGCALTLCAAMVATAPAAAQTWPTADTRIIVPYPPGAEPDVLARDVAQRLSAASGKNVIVGFGGLDEVKFREPVFPGDRLYLLCRMDRMRPGKVFVCAFQGVVRGEIAVEGTLKGVAIPAEAIDPQTQATS